MSKQHVNRFMCLGKGAASFDALGSHNRRDLRVTHHTEKRRGVSPTQAHALEAMVSLQVRKAHLDLLALAA
jgi:hypothetical protein